MSDSLSEYANATNLFLFLMSAFAAQIVANVCSIIRQYGPNTHYVLDRGERSLTVIVLSAWAISIVIHRLYGNPYHLWHTVLSGITAAAIIYLSMKAVDALRPRKN